MLDKADSANTDPVILAIDTADEITGIALMVNGEIASEQNVAVKKGRDTILTEMTANALKSRKLNWKDVDAVAINCGPGSFTGLRVGMAYAKGICYSQDIPLICVDNFHALASSVGNQEVLVVPVIHARADEVYAAIYKQENSNLITVKEGGLYQYIDFTDKLDAPCILLGSGFRRHKTEFMEILGDRLILFPVDISVSSVKWIAKIGFNKFLSRDFAKIEKMEPLYLQDFPKSK